MDMKKMIFVLSLTLGLLVSAGLVACGSSDSEDEKGSGEQQVYDSGSFDFSAKNSDGVTIYYNYLNSEEVEVTFAKNDYYYGYLGYEKLKKIRIPSTVTTNGRTLKVTRIGKEAFVTSEGLLQSIAIPNSITSMGDGALGFAEKIIVSDIAAWCNIKFESAPLYLGGVGGRHIYSNENTEITSLTIPSGVTTIADEAFEGCESITEISLPSTLEKIGKSAFSDCYIKAITIPASVKEIGDYALSTSTLLTVTSLMEEPIPFAVAFGSWFADKTFKNGTLYVPKGTLSKYKEANGWSNFLYIEEL